MTISISLGGSTTGDGFLLAPLDTDYDATLELTSDSGTVSAPCRHHRMSPACCSRNRR